MIRTGDHLRQAREAMGWSPDDLARALRFQANHGGSRILEMEAGKRPISGPASVAVEALLRGFLPVGFDPPSPPSEPKASATLAATLENAPGAHVSQSSSPPGVHPPRDLHQAEARQPDR